MAEVTAQDILTGMPAAFIPANADGINADIQFHLTGNDGGDWVVTVQNGRCTVRQGTVPNPRVNLTADARDFVGVVTGKTNPMMAMMKGRLKVKGDMALAARFPKMFGVG